MYSKHPSRDPQHIQLVCIDRQKTEQDLVEGSTRWPSAQEQDLVEGATRWPSAQEHQKVWVSKYVLLSVQSDRARTEEATEH